LHASLQEASIGAVFATLPLLEIELWTNVHTNVLIPRLWHTTATVRNHLFDKNRYFTGIYWTMADDGAHGLAEGVGFEPTIRFPVYTLSKRAP
jgi:hypothetical protein